MQLPNLVPIPELFVSNESAQKLKAEAGELPSWDLTPRQTCDLELLMNGGFFPLKGFMGEEDYVSVVENMRLKDGSLWPMPITLDVTEAFAAKIEPGQDIALRDQEGVILAIMSVSDRWSPEQGAQKARARLRSTTAPSATRTPPNYFTKPRGPRSYLGGPINRASSAGAITTSRPRRTPRPTSCAPTYRKLGWAAHRGLPDPQTRLAPRHQERTLSRAAEGSPGQPAIHPVDGPDEAPGGNRPFHGGWRC